MWSNNYSKVLNRLGGVTSRVLAFQVVDRGYDPHWAIPKTIQLNNFTAKDTALRNKNTYRLTRKLE